MQKLDETTGYGMALSKQAFWNAMKAEEVSCETCVRPGYYNSKTSKNYKYWMGLGSPFCRLCIESGEFSRWKYNGKK